MNLPVLLDELRAGAYILAGTHTGSNGNGHDIIYKTESDICITFKGGVFYYGITVQTPPAHGLRGSYSEPYSPRKMYQKQIFEAMKEGAKHHATL